MSDILLKSLESGCRMRYGNWRLFENGEAEVRQLAGPGMETRGKWHIFFILESGPHVDMISCNCAYTDYI